MTNSQNQASEPVTAATLQEDGFEHAWSVGVDERGMFIGDAHQPINDDVRRVFGSLLDHAGGSVELKLIAEKLDGNGDRVARVGEALAFGVIPFLETVTQAGELVELDEDVVWVAGRAVAPLHELLRAEETQVAEQLILPENKWALEDLFVREPNERKASEYKKSARIARNLLDVAVEGGASEQMTAVVSTLIRMRGIATPRSVLRASFTTDHLSKDGEEELAGSVSGVIAEIDELLPGHVSRYQYLNNDGKLNDYVGFSRHAQKLVSPAARTILEAPQFGEEARISVVNQAGNQSGIEISPMEHKIMAAFLSGENKDYYQTIVNVLVQLYGSEALFSGNNSGQGIRNAERALKRVNKHLGVSGIELSSIIKVHQDGRESYRLAYRTVGDATLK